MPIDPDLVCGRRLRAMNSNMIFTPDRSVLYVSTPKTGCTTIKMIVAARAGLLDPALLGGRTKGYVHALWAERRPLWSDLSENEREGILEGGGTLRITSIRNPFERLVSCYLNKIVARAEEFYLAKQLAARGEVTMLSFLRFIRDETPLRRDIHYRVMTDMIRPDSIRFDEIIRYETFESDVRRVMSRLNLADFGVPTPAPFRKTEAGARMHALLGPEETDLIREIYRSDFEAFGYSMDLPPATAEGRAAPSAPPAGPGGRPI